MYWPFLLDRCLPAAVNNWINIQESGLSAITSTDSTHHSSKPAEHWLRLPAGGVQNSREPWWENTGQISRQPTPSDVCEGFDKPLFHERQHCVSVDLGRCQQCLSCKSSCQSSLYNRHILQHTGAHKPKVESAKGQRSE